MLKVTYFHRLNTISLEQQLFFLNLAISKIAIIAILPIIGKYKVMHQRKLMKGLVYKETVETWQQASETQNFETSWWVVKMQEYNYQTDVWECIRSDEGLTLETSAFQSLYGGEFTLSTLLINQIFVYHSPTDAAPQFL